MRIQTKAREVGAAEIEAVLRAQEVEYRRKRRLKEYFSGKHAILGKIARENTEINTKTVSNYPAYITSMSVGFFLGQPVTYKVGSAKEAEMAALLDIFKYNDESAHNLELAEEASITGEGYEFLYIDSDAAVRLAVVPSEEVVVLSEATLEGAIIGAVRRYRVYGLDQISYDEYVDYYDAGEVRHYSYNGGRLKEQGRERHYFGDVPVVEYPNNKERRGDFEGVLSLIDAYNLAQSLTMDDLADFTDAFLVLKGLGGTTPEDARALRRSKVLVLDDSGGAEWLIKNLNDTYVENVKSRLQRDIHKFSAVPDMSDESFAGNASGVAIKYKLIGLEQIRSRKEREFKRGLQRRIELIGNVMRLKGQAALDFREVEIQFTANIPANLLEQAQIVSQLDGLISRKTLLGLLPFVTDAAAELAELDGDEA